MIGSSLSGAGFLIGVPTAVSPSSVEAYFSALIAVMNLGGCGLDDVEFPAVFNPRLCLDCFCAERLPPVTANGVWVPGYVF